MPGIFGMFGMPPTTIPSYPTTPETRQALVGRAAELVSHGGDGLHGRRLLLAGHESGEQRRRDGRHRDGMVDGGLHRPPALAGIGRLGRDVGEAGALLQPPHQQVAPRAVRGDVLLQIDLRHGIPSARAPQAAGC